MENNNKIESNKLTKSENKIMNILDTNSNFLLSKPQKISLQELEKKEKKRGATFHFKGHKYELNYENGETNCTVTYEGILPDGLSDKEKTLFELKKDTKGSPYYIYKIGEQETQELNIGIQTEYFIHKPLTYENSEINPIEITIDELINFIKTKNIVFYSGAGISMSSGVFDMKGLKTNLGIDPTKSADDFIKNILNNPNKTLSVFGDFCDIAFNGQPTDAHKALTKIAEYKKTTICTENFDLLHERTGVNAYHVSASDIKTLFNPEQFKDIDGIICLGLSHDDRGLLGRYREFNKNGKIISLDLQKPDYLGNEDFLFKGDLQIILPLIESKLH